MAIRKYQDAAGNWVEVDDEVSLLGPPPQNPAKESTRNPLYQPIQYTHTGGAKPPTPKHDPHSLGPQPMPDSDDEDAGNTGLNDPEYLKRQGINGNRGTTRRNTGVNDPAFLKLWEEKNKGGV